MITLQFVKIVDGVEVTAGESIQLGIYVGQAGANAVLPEGVVVDTEYASVKAKAESALQELPDNLVIDANYVHTDNNLTNELALEIGKVAGKQDSTDIGLNTTNKNIVSAINEVRGLALETPIGLVFATKATLDLWLTDSENKASLKNAQNLYIIDTNTPDYWWDFSAQVYHEIETKIDLSGYLTSEQIALAYQPLKSVLELYVSQTEKDTWNGKQNSLTFSTDIEADKASTTKISAIKTFYDWCIGLFAPKANPIFSGVVKAPAYQDLLGNNLYANQNSFTIWYNDTWFTPTGVLSSNGINVTTTGGQLTGSMVGAKIGVGLDRRVILTVPTANTCTVDSAFSQNYISQSYGVYSVAITTSLFGILYYRNRIGIGVQNIDFSYDTNAMSFNALLFGNNSYIKPLTYDVASSFAFKFSGTSEFYGSKDTGFLRNSAGVLEINNGTAGQFRDLKLRNLISSGLIYPQQAASAPTYVKGGMYFDTTLNKMRIGGATGWETIQSI